MKVVYSARYRIDIGPHVFPTDKYQRVHARLVETGVINRDESGKLIFPYDKIHVDFEISAAA